MDAPDDERLYSTLVNSLDGIVWEADGATFRFSFVSPQAERILGYPPAQWLESPDFWVTHLHPDDRDWCVNFCVEATKDGRDHEFEYRMIAANGQTVWLHDLVTVRREPNGQKTLRGIMVNITARKHAEEALRKSEQQILALSERLILAQEEERLRIARELHDNVGQQIAAVSIALSNIKRQVGIQDSALREQADRVYRKVSNVAETVRNLSHGLHPTVLEHAGLAAALRAHCSEFTVLTGVNIAFHADDAFADLPAEESLCLYRVAQEGLQNVAKHARTKSANLSLARRNGQVCLTISDNGCGFEAGGTHTSVGLGLVNMKERVRLVHGKLDVISHPHDGTTLRVYIPAKKPLIVPVE
jgi:PAS domain S-box-containing protein